MIDASFLGRLALLRTLVGYLGEQEQFAWWDTSSLSPVGQRFLERLFPGTALLAGVETASQAARALHDERIGRLRVFHLFRLPSTTEEVIRDHLGQVDAADFRAKLQSKDQALATLHELAAGLDESATSGPVRVGTIQALRRGRALERMAHVYHHAFVQGETCFPYLTVA